MEFETKSTQEQENHPATGPYRATKIWNDLIRTFRLGVPLRRHRRNFRTYDDCFSASEAVDWLHEHLKHNVNFGSHVTREQTVQLLHKFQKTEVFEDVRGAKTDKEFDDDGRLYRFTKNVPVRQGRAPLVAKSTNVVSEPSTPKKPEMKDALNESSRPSSPLGSLTLGPDQVKLLWKQAIGDELKRLIGIELEDGDLWRQVETINSDYVYHNATMINNSGVVTNVDRKDDLPHWVLSAMKCLAHWPHSSDGEDLPNYPGFEKDVFRLVKGYFLDLANPLIPSELYSLLDGAFGRAQAPPPKPPRVEELRRPPLRRFAPHPLAATASVENLICMLLPPSNRRKLHLLTRLMYKMLHNDVIKLDDIRANSEVIIDTFRPCILCPKVGHPSNVEVEKKLVSLLTTHYVQIFTVPESLRRVVQDRLLILTRRLVSPQSEYRNLTFCNQRSTEEFEHEKRQLSQSAVADLLEAIVKNTTMASKEKKRRLKKFKEAYPAIYAERFPTVESEKRLFAVEKPKIKQPLLARPLSKLKILRF